MFPFLESSDSTSTMGTSGFLIKTDELSSQTLSQPLPPLITSSTACKQEMNSPSAILPNGAAKITNKILIDHTKQTNSNFILSPSHIKSEQMNMNENSSSLHPNLLQSSLLSSPRSAFSRTSKTSTHSPDQRRIIKGIFNIYFSRFLNKVSFVFRRRIRISIFTSITITFK